MQPVAVITDSVACLTKDLLGEYGIPLIPINFLVGGRLYHDMVDVTPSRAYELFLQDPDSFKTSAPTPRECLDVYRNVIGSQDILVITMSAKISSTCDVARQAARMIMEEQSRHRIEVFDSGTAAAAEGFVVLAAARAASQDKGLEDVKAAALQVKTRVSCYFMLDTVRHVYRSGRVPRFAAQAGSVLSVRPLLTIVNGKVQFIGAFRSKTHGIEQMLDRTGEKVGGSPAHIAVMHAYDLEQAKALQDRVRARFNCAELWISEFSPLMGYATGTGTLGLAFYLDN